MKPTLLIALLKTFYLANKHLISQTLKKQLPVYILLVLLLVPLLNFGQENKPKVALVLSGGGAKGIAHIPLLQKLDSLGIVPDMVLGTSMGSIVGGLYAMGYSGDSIANIANNADWDVLLGGSIPLSKVSVEEKSEFKKYLIDLDLKDGKPKASSSILNDQNLREFLSSMVYPVYNVKDFDNLSIPFRAIATDIVNGKEVILDKGSLALAMRASMSIPGVFRPVPYKGTLLVDGGILNNFPTDVAKKMGADIIIGSDVGGGMATIDKLDNIPALLFQSSMLTSNLKNPEHQKDCDILVNHITYLTYSTGDFNNSKEIFEEGKIATNINLDALISLANTLKKYEQNIHALPKVKDEFILDSIAYVGISEANLELVKDRANIKPNVKYTVADLIDGVNRAIGTNLFSQITTDYYVTDSGKLTLVIHGFEHSPHQVKGSFHYDTYRGVGMILNYTGRNVLGESSRFIATIDIAEQPRFRLGYQKIFGEEKSWWWKSEVYGEGLKQELFISGNQVEDMRSKSLQVDNQINKNLNSLKNYIGLGLDYEFTKITPKLNPEYSENIINLERYKFNNIELYGQFLHNSLDDVFYPTSGDFLQVSVARSLMQDIDLIYYNNELPEVKGKTNGYTKLALNFEKRFQINKKITGIVGATGNFIFEDAQKSDQISFSEFGYASKYFLGGSLLIPKKDSYTFLGLYEGELNASQFTKLNLGVQFNPLAKIYITPQFNIATVGFYNFDDFIEEAFSPKGKWEEGIETSLLMSAGATVSYYSLLGPINFDVAWVNDINKVRLFFSVGFMFTPSNR